VEYILVEFHGIITTSADSNTTDSASNMAFFGGGGSSSDTSEQEDELLFPSTNPAEEEFTQHRRKRRKTGRDSKESAALGIFGSESDNDRPGRRWKERSLRTKGVGFVKQGNADGVEDDSIDDDGNEGEDVVSFKQEDAAKKQPPSARRLGFRSAGAGQEDAPGTPLGRCFVPSSSRQPILNVHLSEEKIETPTMFRPSFVMSSASPRQSGRGRATAGQSSANPNSFAAKMMAKMGYVEGHGLGSSGQGILNPVETKLRPQGVGLGAVREKTQQAKEEAKREAQRRGEVLVDSSEEERKRRKARAKQPSGQGSGASTPGGGKSRAKPKYRTVADIVASADGLEVPNVLKSIIDATGKETRLLTSTSGLMTPTEGVPVMDTEAMKITRRARQDLEAFADEWNGLKAQTKYLQVLESQLNEEIDEQQEEARRLKGVTEVVSTLSGLEIDNSDTSLGANSTEPRWDQLVIKLEALEFQFRDEIDRFELTDAAIAAIHPLFCREMDRWQPLAEPLHLLNHIQRLRRLLGVEAAGNKNALSLVNGYHHLPDQQKSTTPYETMIYTLWLPRVRSAITNDWDVHKPSAAISLIEAWKDVLPSFVYANVIDQLVVQKLTRAVADWTPRGSHKKKRHQQPPHIWLFPWLPYLDEHHTDPRSSSGLLADVKRKFRVVIDDWDLSKGVLEGLGNWKEVLRGELDNVLIRHLLPRLASYMQENFEVNPQDQDLTALEQVLLWKDFFKPSTMSQLLVAEFFPKWHNILYIWLTSEPNYEEIWQWFSWWKTQIPQELNDTHALAAEWERGLEMINQALDLGYRAATELPAPTAGPVRPIKPAVPSAPSVGNGVASITPSARRPQQETSFKDVVDDWCVEQGLIMVPLREAHSQTGLPLFRITASVNGKGGLLVYLKGDVVWAQNKKDKSVWEPVGLDGTLLARAEGR